MGDNYGPPPKRGAEHERLAVWVGRWHAEGQSYGGPNQNPSSPKADATKWESDETTVWHPGQFFVVQREDARIGTDSLITHSVLGFDSTSGEYYAHAFENHGYYRRYRVRVEGRIWTFESDTERATVEMSADGKRQTVRWEWRPKDDRWLPLCERVNERVG